jgi:hemerythrin-like metal-binding protein
MHGMPLFTWNPAYLIGIPEVDADHFRLFSLADDVHVALARMAPGRDIQDALAALIDHTRAHFAREEDYMARTGYPELKEHRAEHERLIGGALQIQRDFITHGRTLTPEILRSLRDWLVGHIDHSDRKIAAGAAVAAR